MTFGVLIDTITAQEGRTQKNYEYLRFIDSYKMMKSSLEKLVEILPYTLFDIMKAMFPSVSESNAHLLKQKGYYPYSYVCDRTLMYVIVQNGSIHWKAENWLLVKKIYVMLSRCGSYWVANLYKTIMTHTLNWTAHN